MKNHLEVIIPDHNNFYSLYSDGMHSWKTYDRRKKASLFYYAPHSVVILYYTYPTYREACVIRHSASDGNFLPPGVSEKVTLLFSVHASKVDKLKRAVGWLNKHTRGAFVHNDGFYARLSLILDQRGKINYPALSMLAKKSLSKA